MKSGVRGRDEGEGNGGERREKAGIRGRKQGGGKDELSPSSSSSFFPLLSVIVIHNLLYGLENGSFVDIKLGTNTLTAGKENNLIKKKTRDVVDVEITTSHLLGFTVCGMNLKYPETGNPRDGGKVKKS